MNTFRWRRARYQSGRKENANTPPRISDPVTESAYAEAIDHSVAGDADPGRQCGRQIHLCKRSFAAASMKIPRRRGRTDGTGQIHPLPGKQVLPSATSAG